MGDARDLLGEWQEARYVAFVNFMRKKGLYDEWKAFKAGRKDVDAQDLMIAYIMRIMMERGEKGGA
ncbi:MAG: hypothetical protein IJR14_04605 [Synergistaceae bacterium]|nr:hypothetical protein [Synergistaceae bacterium]